MATDSLHDRGFAQIEGLLSAVECANLGDRTSSLGVGSAGTRNLLAAPWCRAFLADLRERPAIVDMLPPGLVAVQGTYFEKSTACNWLVPWHQDLSLPVAARVDEPSLRGWSDKEGGLFVQGPDDVLARMVAVRLHLDACGPDDGPLRVSPGSHRRGRIDPESIPDARRAFPEFTCLAAPGDALLMRPLLLHASSKASGVSRRRVLHFLFGPAELPFGLRWGQAI